MSVKNETVYDNNLINEAAKILTKKYKLVIAGSVLILAAIACYYGATASTGSRITVIVVPIVGMFAVLSVGLIRINGYKKTLLQRLKVLNHDDVIKCSYEIDAEKMVVTSPNGKNTLYHKDIKKISETSNIYLIIYSGAVFAMLAKAGFDGDSEREFRSFVNL